MLCLFQELEKKAADLDRKEQELKRQQQTSMSITNKSLKLGFVLIDDSLEKQQDIDFAKLLIFCILHYSKYMNNLVIFHHFFSSESEQLSTVARIFSMYSVFLS